MIVNKEGAFPCGNAPSLFYYHYAEKEWNAGDSAVIGAGKVAVAALDKVVQGFAPAEKGKAHFIVEGQNRTALLVGMTDELIRFRV